MRVTLSVKVFGLVAVGVVSSVLTSSSLAQVRGRPKRAAQAAQGVPVVSGVIQGKTQVVSHVSLAQARADGGVAIRASGNPDAPSPIEIANFVGKSFDVRVQGRDVFVDAAVDMKDSRDGILYYWSLQVTKGADKDVVLSRRAYTDQVFSMPAAGELSPTFSEHLILDPGDYRMELHLHHGQAATIFPRPQPIDRPREARILTFSRRIKIAP